MLIKEKKFYFFNYSNQLKKNYNSNKKLIISKWISTELNNFLKILIYFFL